MAAIEHVSERLYDSESTDVDMSSVPEEKDQLKESSSTSSLTNSMVSSPMDPENEKFQMKFLVTGTSSRQHHSGKKKVVRNRFYPAVPTVIKNTLVLYKPLKNFYYVSICRRLKILNSSKCLAKEHLGR